MSNINDYLGPGASQTGPGSYVLPATTIYGTSAGVSAMGDSFRIIAGPNTTKYDPHREAMLANRAEYKEFYTELSRIEKEVKEKYEEILSKTDKYVQDELQASEVSSTQSRPSVDKLHRDTKVLEGLISRRETDRQILIEQSKAYSGSDPLSLSIEKRNSYAILGAPRYRPTVKAQIQKNYGESYTAAYQAKWLEVLIKKLKSELYLRQIQIPEAQAEAARVANTFHIQGSVAVAQPLFTAVRGTLAIEGGAAALATAIRSAIAGLAGFVAGAASSAAVGVIAFLAFPRELGNGELPERYSFSTPLSDLAPSLGSQELQDAAAKGGTVDLSVRISSKIAEDGRSEVFVVKTDGATVSSKVKVIAATYNAGQNVYTATTADVPPRTLTWTPIVSPGNSSTTSPAEQMLPPVYTGATVTPVQGRIDTFPTVAEGSFDDYIFVYPVGSGLIPIYMMFRDRREDPGVVTGVGQPVSGVWLGAVSQGDGAPIPSQIADQLRGSQFKNFRAFREAFWKAVANDPVLSKQFKAVNLGRMRRGYAPYAIPSEQVGDKVKFELHHVIFLKNNGALYDIDNIRVVTPKEHTALHK